MEIDDKIIKNEKVRDYFVLHFFKYLLQEVGTYISQIEKLNL